MRASSGISVWKPGSNTPTSGMRGAMSRKYRMQAR